MVSRQHRRRSSRNTETTRWDRHKIIRAVFALIGATILGLIIIRVTSTPILLGRGHSAILMLAPTDPTVVLKFAEREFARNGELSHETLERVRAAATRAPLAAEPFFFVAGDVTDPAERIRLLEETRRRNPRMRLARLMLVDQYIRAGRIDEAAVEIKVLNRLVSEVSELLVDQLARLAANPETRPALKRAVGNDPLLDQILIQLVRRNVDTDLILDIAQPRLGSYSAATPPAWQRLLVESRVESGDVATALRVWQRFNQVPLPENSLYNPGFANVPGAPPFNWKLNDDATGVAEPGRDGLLDILYFGRADSELARQLLLLAPGRYRLQLSATSNDQAGGSRLSWQVICANGNNRLASLSLDELSSRPRQLRADFEVPAGCEAQWIRLVGEAAEFPTRREVQVRGLRLARLETGR